MGTGSDGGEIAGQGDGARVGDRPTRGLGEIAGGLEAGELGALDEAVEERGDLGAAQRLRPVVVFAPEHNGPFIRNCSP